VKYMMLLYADESRPDQFSDETMAAYGAFTEEVQDKVVMLSGEALQTTESATSVRVRDGRVRTTDGPFAETKEQLGGFYILDCRDLDEAIAYAAKIPAASSGTVEVRPIMEFPED
jgi:hypothetical protein